MSATIRCQGPNWCHCEEHLVRWRIAGWAHNRVNAAIGKGEMAEASTFLCADCRSVQAVEYDHRDYTKPLEVDPVCHRCNSMRGNAVVKEVWENMKAMMTTVVLVGVSLFAVGCGSSPAAPTATAAAPLVAGATTITVPSTPTLRHEIDYDINIPFIGVAQQLIERFQPHGAVYTAPITAQSTWDYRKEYGGSANAYYGPLAGESGQYIMTGIAIAPTNVARVDTFLGADWPGIGLEPYTTYTWVGHFVYTPPGQPGDVVPPVFGPPLPPRNGR